MLGQQHTFKCIPSHLKYHPNTFIYLSTYLMCIDLLQIVGKYTTNGYTFLLMVIIVMIVILIIL